MASLRSSRSRTAFLWPTASPNTALSYRVNDFQAYTPIYPPAYLTWFQSMWWPPQWGPKTYTTVLQSFMQTSASALDAAGVRYVVVPKGQVPQDTSSQPFDLKLQTLGHSVTVYRNAASWPMVFVARTLLDARSNSDLITRIVRQGLPYETAGVLHGVTRPYSPPKSVRLSYSWKGPNEFTVNTHASSPAFLVALVSFSTGWRVNIDGRPARPEMVNGLFTGTWIPKGTAHLIFVFRPKGQDFGILIGLLGLFGVIALHTS